MPNDNTWHPRGVRGRQVSPEEAGWILGEQAAQHAEERQAQLAAVEHLVPPTQDEPPSTEQTEKPKRGRPRKTAVKKKAAPNKTGPASAPKKTKGPKAQ